MRLGWDEIKRRARAFSEDWKDAHYEKGETQPFYEKFFEIFGVSRRSVGTYEKRVEHLDSGKRGFIDLFWPGTLIVEQKSAGRSLKAAQLQALDYFDWLPERDQPKYILSSDFQNFTLIDLEQRSEFSFKLSELADNIEAFTFILGRRRTYDTQPQANIDAAELMGKLHDALKESGYTGHPLELLLVRLLFCLFADDTGIFEPKDIFLNLLEERSAEDGSDVGRWLNDLFDTLDQPEGQRQKTLDAELQRFPYINGALFAGRLPTPAFDTSMRKTLLEAARFNWSAVSPAIFGSLFQSVMDAKERRAKGAHYTSEANILKVIGPLFLDDLRAEFERLRSFTTTATGRARKAPVAANRARLVELQRRLKHMTFFDPACGCGNFLVVAYREVRRLELDILTELYGDEAVISGFDSSMMSQVNVDQFYGIEYEEFPARIAEVAMWMADHLANNELSLAFGQSFARIPLKQSARIVHADALEIDWADVLPPEDCSYIMGNPPFVGAKYQSQLQREQVRKIAGLGGSGGTLDYVAAWFIKAGQFAKVNPRIRVAFVSTNSICQGEQVAQLWPILFDRFGLEIAFAHRTFSWGSEARGKAHVHVVIVGLAHRDNEPAEKRLFSYPDNKGDPVESQHGALTAYLFDARSVANRHLVVKEASQPINGAPKLVVGSKPVDGGYLIFTPEERQALAIQNPGAERLLRPFIGAKEFLNGGIRYIIDAENISPTELQQYPILKERVSKVRQWRLGEIASKNSKDGKDRAAKSTRPLAPYPTRFHVNIFPKHGFLIVPENGSERREYVPAGWQSHPVIPSSLVRIALDANLWHFSIMSSRLHMAWVSHIGGKLKSDPRYSIGLVYNTFPWADASPAQREKIEALAQVVLDARAAYPTASLADLYDPDTMPAVLRKAHAALDTAVDRLYRPAPFASDRDRVEHLFGRYEAMVNPLERLGAAKNKRVAKKAAGEKQAEDERR
jgi:hypothetical protein